jgi:hypothetical protein
MLGKIICLDMQDELRSTLRNISYWVTHLAFSAFLAAFKSRKYCVMAFAASLCSLIVMAAFEGLLQTTDSAQCHAPLLVKGAVIWLSSAAERGPSYAA